MSVAVALVSDLGVQQDGHGHNTLGAQSLFADLSLLHTQIAHYGRLVLELQRPRVRLDLSLAAHRRDGFSEEWLAPLLEAREDLHAIELATERHLRRLCARHPLAGWVAEAPGLGLPGFGRLLAITGPLDQFATVSKLWRYLGLDVREDGRAPRRRKGERLGYSPRGRVLAYQLGESIVRLGRGRYRETYDRKHAEYEAARPDWPPSRRDRAARRYAVKRLLRDLWVRWRRQAAVGPWEIAPTPMAPVPLKRREPPRQVKGDLAAAAWPHQWEPYDWKITSGGVWTRVLLCAHCGRRCDGQACRICGRCFPSTAVFFVPERPSRGGLRDECRECRNTYERRRQRAIGTDAR